MNLNDDVCLFYITYTVYGLSDQNQIYVDSQNLYTDMTVSNCKNVKSFSHFTHKFRGKDSFVDILLNCDIGELKFGVVGKIYNNENDRDQFEKIFINLPNNECGWKPHINVYMNRYSPSLVKCRIAKISHDLYGIPDDEIFV